jgi:hypothetical protein
MLAYSSSFSNMALKIHALALLNQQRHECQGRGETAQGLKRFIDTAGLVELGDIAQGVRPPRSFKWDRMVAFTPGLTPPVDMHPQTHQAHVQLGIFCFHPVVDKPPGSVLCSV